MATATFTHEWYLHLIPVARLSGPASAVRTEALARAAQAVDGSVLEAGDVFSLRQALAAHAPGGDLTRLAPAEELDRLAGALFELALRIGCRIVSHHAPVEPVPVEGGRAFSCAATLDGGADLAFAAMEGPVQLGVEVRANILQLTVRATAPAAVWTRLEAAPDRSPAPRVCEKRVRRLLLEATTERALGFDEVTVRRVRVPRHLRPQRRVA